MITVDKPWAIVFPKNYKNGMVYALSDTRKGAWENAAMLMYNDIAQVKTLKKEGFRARRVLIAGFADSWEDI